MEIECTCGHTFEPPQDAAFAECPRCGRRVALGEGRDWLDGLGEHELELADETGPSPAPPQPEGQGEQSPADGEEGEPDLELGFEPDRSPQQAPDSGPSEPREAEFELELESPPATERSQPEPPARPPADTARPGAAPEIPAPGPQEEEEERVSGLDAVRRFGDLGPMGVAVTFRRRPEQSEFTALVIGFGLLALVTAGPLAYLAGGGGLGLGRAVGMWVGLMVEAALAGALLAGLGWLIGRQETSMVGPIHPLGVAEAVVIVRVLSAALVFAVAVGLALVVGLLGGPAEAPSILAAPGRHLIYLYLLALFIGQAALVLPTMDLGCAVAGVINLAVVLLGAHFVS